MCFISYVEVKEEKERWGHTSGKSKGDLKRKETQGGKGEYMVLDKLLYCVHVPICINESHH